VKQIKAKTEVASDFLGRRFVFYSDNRKNIIQKSYGRGMETKYDPLFLYFFLSSNMIYYGFILTEILNFFLTSWSFKEKGCRNEILVPKCKRLRTLTDVK
jgi:hypothetical protein